MDVTEIVIGVAGSVAVTIPFCLCLVLLWFAGKGVYVKAEQDQL